MVSQVIFLMNFLLWGCGGVLLDEKGGWYGNGAGKCSSEEEDEVAFYVLRQMGIGNEKELQRLQQNQPLQKSSSERAPQQTSPGSNDGVFVTVVKEDENGSPRVQTKIVRGYSLDDPRLEGVQGAEQTVITKFREEKNENHSGVKGGVVALARRKALERSRTQESLGVKKKEIAKREKRRQKGLQKHGGR